MGAMEMLPTPNLLKPHNLMVIQVRETQDHHNLQMEEAVVVVVVAVAVELHFLEPHPLICLREPHNHHNLQMEEAVVAVVVGLQVQVLLQQLYQFKDHGKDH